MDVDVQGIRTEEEYLEILRNRIIWCICHNLQTRKLRTFHAIDMVEDCARAFLDEKGVTQYLFSGEHDYYKDTLENVYGPLVTRGLLTAYENNNFKIPEGSKLEKICQSKDPVVWKDIDM